MSPPEREEPGPTPETGPHHKALADTKTNQPNLSVQPRQCGFDTVAGLHRRRAASRRLPGSDPWWYEPPTAGYEIAAAHLLSHGLTPAPDPEGLREMWKSGGDQRLDAQIIASRWDLSA